MRWTRGALLTRALILRTVKSCGPDASTPASSWRKYPPMTVTRKPITGESAKETVKTIAQGRPGISGEPVVTTLVCFVLFRTRGCGCDGHPAFPAPSVFLGERILHRSGVSRRGNAESCPGCLKIEFFTLSRTSEHSERDPGP